MRIAVWNTAFLGDSVLTLPLIRVLKAAWPDAELDFYVRGGLASLYEAQPEISRVFSCDKRGKDKGLAAMFREGRGIAERAYDIWVDAHLSLRSSYMAWASRAPVRAGYAEAALSRFVFTRRIGRRFHELQEIERLLLLAEALDVPRAVLDDEALRWPELSLPPRAVEEAQGAAFAAARGQNHRSASRFGVADQALDSGRLCLYPAPGAGAERERRASGGPRRRGNRRKRAKSCGRSRGRAPFSRSFGQNVAAFSGRRAGPSGRRRATNDSGPDASGLGAAHAGDGAVRPHGAGARLCAARKGEHRHLDQASCRPCGLHGHKTCPKGHFACMKNIDPEAVWRDVERKLAARTQE